MCFMRECYLPAAAYNGIDLASGALYVVRRVRPRRKNLVPIAHMLYTLGTRSAVNTRSALARVRALNGVWARLKPIKSRDSANLYA